MNLSSLSAAVLAFFVVADETLSPTPPFDCVCAVLNSISTTTSSGSCTTGGASVPCFSASTVTYPQGGEPSDGECHDLPACSGPNVCTYKNMQVTVTIAPCAASCGVKATVPFEERHPEAPTHNLNGTQAVGTSAPYVFKPHGISQDCGTGQKTMYIRWLKKNGLNAFELTGKFGCGDCDVGGDI